MTRRESSWRLSVLNQRIGNDMTSNKKIDEIDIWASELYERKALLCRVVQRVLHIQSKRKGKIIMRLNKERCTEKLIAYDLFEADDIPFILPCEVEDASEYIRDNGSLMVENKDWLIGKKIEQKGW